MCKEKGSGVEERGYIATVCMDCQEFCYRVDSCVTSHLLLSARLSENLNV